MFEDGIALRKQHGAENVFDLSLGNPILEPPLEFRETLLAIASDSAHGNHRYMPNGGFPETRTSIASALSKETGLPFENNHLIMTCGAGGALNVTFKALLDPGEEVIVIAPYFGEHIYGAIDDYQSFSKAQVIQQILDNGSIAAEKLVGFGDG